VVRAVPALLADSNASELFTRTLSTLGHDREDLMDVALRVLADCSATPNGEPLDDQAAQRIVARVWPKRDAHQSCIIARVPLPSANAETADD
jgi:hypothetical protein